MIRLVVTIAQTASSSAKSGHLSLSLKESFNYLRLLAFQFIQVRSTEMTDVRRPPETLAAASSGHRTYVRSDSASDSPWRGGNLRLRLKLRLPEFILRLFIDWYLGVKFEFIPQLETV